MTDPPSSFIRFYEIAKRAIEEPAQYASDGDRVLWLTPPSPKELARLAESTPEFEELALALAPSKEPQRYLVSDLLRRSGFYHGVLAGASEATLWSCLSKYTRPRTAKINTLMLLDGCAFPRNRFDLVGHSIVRHSASEIKGLGPPPEIAETFFSNETLDSDWYSQQWFLRDTRNVDLTPTFIQIPFFGGDYVLDRYWAPLIALGLYDLPCFAIPIVLESEARWKLMTPRFSSPRLGMSYNANGEPFEVPTDDYKVADHQWSQFEGFLGFCDESIGSKRDWGPVRIAARRYLRATFLSTPDGDAFDVDDSEDILLQYIYGLESLVLAGDREAIRDKIATRVALIAGRDDNERKEINAFVKKAYDARSVVAHGGKKTGNIDLKKLRDISRRVIVVLLAVARRCRDPGELAEIIREIPINRATQDALAEDRDEVFPLVKAIETRI